MFRGLINVEYVLNLKVLKKYCCYTILIGCKDTKTPRNTSYIVFGQKPKVVCLNKCFIKRIVLPHLSSLIPCKKKNHNSFFFTSVSIKFTLDIFTHCFPFLYDILFLNLHNEIEKNLDSLFKDIYFKL